VHYLIEISKLKFYLLRQNANTLHGVKQTEHTVSQLCLLQNSNAYNNDYKSLQSISNVNNIFVARYRQCAGNRIRSSSSSSSSAHSGVTDAIQVSVTWHTWTPPPLLLLQGTWSTPAAE